MQKTFLITGSNGLIGSNAVLHFGLQSHRIHGVDNNMRKYFFGEKGNTLWNLKRLQQSIKTFSHHNIDIRHQKDIFRLFRDNKFNVVIHCAAQPSHDWAKREPLVDFQVNAVGTLNLLEATRLYCPEATFIFMSTNKVYGDRPNIIPLKELETRWEYNDSAFSNGIDENLGIDDSTHSIFGASKIAADIMVQEYGRYFGLNTVCFRGGCLTGPQHSGVELHGFLSYLIKVAVTNGVYTVFGYKGKQVRDQIHSYDVVCAFEEFINNPKKGAVYNLGGGKENSISIIESFKKIEAITGRKVNYEYNEESRKGDHICYYSDMTRFKKDYPNWSITKTLDDIFQEMVETEKRKLVL